MKDYKKLEKEIEKIIAKSPVKTESVHSKATKKWLLKLKPDADEALQIAALAHDIERAFNIRESASPEDFSRYVAIKAKHAKKSAKIIGDLLKKHGFNAVFIRRVKHLIELHEIGGDADSDLLRDSDSLSFFGDNIENYFEIFGEEKTKCKIKFMYNRISERAKRIVKKFKYKNPELNNIFKQTVS